MASSARIDELRKKFEENPRRYFAPLANEYRKAGEIEQAIAICREYLPQQPGHMSGHIVYGQALYEARQFDEAKTVFETALALDPENLIALRHLGDIALIIGDSDGARTWYRRVLDADPRNEEIQAQLATLDQSAPSGSPVITTAAPTPVIGTPITSPTPVVGMPTASSAPTVVVAAVPPPARTTDDAHRRPTKEVRDPYSPPPLPSAAVTADSPTGEIRLDDAPGASGAQTKSPVPHLELDSPVGGATAPPDSTPRENASLAGLETTSLAEPQSLSTTPTVELDLATHSPPEASAQPAPAGVTESDEVVAAATPTPPDLPLELEVVPPSPPPMPAADRPPELLDLGAPAPIADAPPAAQASPTSSGGAAELPMIDLGEPVAPKETAPVADAGPFVTETMAELYLQQGHREEALRVYRALLDQRPGDATLQAKVAGLQRPASSSTASPEPPPPAQESAPTIRDVLAVVAMRRPGSGAASPRANGAPQPTEAPPSVAEFELADSNSRTSPQPASRNDALSSLFGDVAITAADEGAARSLALAFADTNGAGGGATDVAGAPARRASNELSLDSVFGHGEAGSPAAPSSFSFDQFFSARASTQGPAPTAESDSSTAPPDDVAHFTKWLEGLKQR